jgi:hypothetical protein
MSKKITPVTEVTFKDILSPNAINSIMDTFDLTKRSAMPLSFGINLTEDMMIPFSSVLLATAVANKTTVKRMWRRYSSILFVERSSKCELGTE